MLRVLVVEDHASTREALVDVLRVVGYDAVEAASGREALELVTTSGPDLMVLDLGLPDLDGIEVIREVRELSDLPVLVVSGTHRRRRKADALDAGADDFIEKPFDVGELRARLHAVTRRRSRGLADDPRRTYGDIEVDVEARTLSRSGREIRLTETEWRLLDALTARAGAVVTHQRLAATVWGPRARKEVYPTLRVHIASLRRKLRDGGQDPQVIRGESGMGYRWVAAGDQRAARDRTTVLHRAVALRDEVALLAPAAASGSPEAEALARASDLVDALERLEART
ncbi:response regulator transcription factor [Nocardioides renjunii]|uniref:response regulator transcription factor n=1 Tax=Nocardioides renjunii TaxID=3095075 RepID=UPI002AFE7D78|nr:response regulator transcription factor [Nocardioides sp. S-34]WQQ22802.1 response regulator transcription factor [Nocardioides sp. S-34]